MKGKDFAMPQIDPATRCQYRDSAGRRCRRHLRDGHPVFCRRHARPDPSDSPSGLPNPRTHDISPELLGPLQDFRTAAGINFTLGRLLILTAANRISSRDASVMAYICQLLLQSLSAVRHEITWSDGSSEEDKQVRRVLEATSSLFDTEDSPKQRN
jgi:hypothetical protein